MKSSNDTKALMVKLRPLIDAALAEIAKKNGVKSLSLAQGTYSAGGNFKWSLEGVAEGGLDKDAERYQNEAENMGLPPLGTEFRSGPRTYKIVGLNTTGSKVIVEQDGKRYLTPVDIVRDLTTAKAKAA